jgi:hypothetical protein
MYDIDDENDMPRRAKKKNTAKWCRGKVGVWHEIEIVKSKYFPNNGCGWRTVLWKSNEMRYSCFHQKSCKNCGKVVDYFLDDKKECPDYKECSCGMQ